MADYNAPSLPTGQPPPSSVRFQRVFLLLLVVAAVALAGGLYWWANEPVRMASSPVEFRILPGTGLRGIAAQVVEAGVDTDPRLLVALGRWMGAEKSLKAGSYAVHAGVTPLLLLKKLTAGDVSQGEIKLLEGWTFRQWREKLDAHPDLTHDSSGLSEADLLRRLGLPYPQAEGLFFPDTYLFDKHSSDIELLARAARGMQRRLELEWNQRAAGLPYQTPYQALTMASIVEKETGRDADRPMISAVFVNRLRIGMLLQTDPTVIYGLGERFDGNLRKRDLLADTPYNTYTRAGLPPTPIAMPGVASLRAAMNPANSDVRYFVARGDGSSQFSRTLEEHNRAVNRYQRGGK